MPLPSQILRSVVSSLLLLLAYLKPHSYHSRSNPGSLSLTHSISLFLWACGAMALTSFSAKVFTNGNSHCKAFPSSRAVLRRPEIFFLRSPRIGPNVSQCKTIRSVASVDHSFSGIPVSTGLETFENGNRGLECLETVRVKFLLQKECLFGEQFMLVGDDPLFGSWDPSNAMPLNWSDGHLWTVEMEIPEEKLIQFKFVLKTSTGDVLWQPGPDRVLRTWKTKNTIVISEDWEDAQVQKISEDMMTAQNQGFATNPAAGEASIFGDELILRNNNEDMMSSKSNVNPEVRHELFNGKRRELIHGRGALGDEEALFAYGEGAVLVPGLTQ